MGARWKTVIMFLTSSNMKQYLITYASGHVGLKNAWLLKHLYSRFRSHSEASRWVGPLCRHFSRMS